MATERPLQYSDQSMKNIACIFDLDGVLVDTADYHYETWKRLASELGHDIGDSLYEQLKGISRRSSLEILLNHCGIIADEPEKHRLSNLKNKWFIESLESVDHSVLLPGVLNFITSLNDRGIDCAVGSASRNAARILRQLSLDSRFVSIVDGNDVLHTKPDPEVFLNAARDLQYNESDCIVFEDSKKGLIAAKEGGFSTVGIGDPKVLQAADLVINGFEEADYRQIVAKLKG